MIQGAPQSSLAKCHGTAVFQMIDEAVAAVALRTSTVVPMTGAAACEAIPCGH
jgi:hypothetical protein